ncbi:MAG: hypothetical protein HYS98_02815 [Deltaproteobacteria bacterium]|nr:hypothetical protein [Deltaproteobacteria bacterium]
MKKSFMISIFLSVLFLFSFQISALPDDDEATSAVYSEHKFSYKLLKDKNGRTISDVSAYLETLKKTSATNVLKFEGYEYSLECGKLSNSAIYVYTHDSGGKEVEKIKAVIVLQYVEVEGDQLSHKKELQPFLFPCQEEGPLFLTQIPTKSSYVISEVKGDEIHFYVRFDYNPDYFRLEETQKSNEVFVDIP